MGSCNVSLASAILLTVCICRLLPQYFRQCLLTLNISSGLNQNGEHRPVSFNLLIVLLHFSHTCVQFCIALASNSSTQIVEAKFEAKFPYNCKSGKCILVLKFEVKAVQSSPTIVNPATLVPHNQTLRSLDIDRRPRKRSQLWLSHYSSPTEKGIQASS